MKPWFCTVIILAALLAAGGCKDKLSLDAQGNPRTLVMGFYQGDDPGEVGRVMEPIRLYLQKKLGIPVEFQTSTDYTTVIEALVTKKIHLSYLSPLPYVLATQKMKLEPLVVLGMNGLPYMYSSLLLASPASGIRNMDQLKARAKDLTLCFADPASTSGHIIPKAYLTSIGLDPDKAFKQTMFAGSHYASTLSVKSGKVDLGCTFNLSLEKMIREGIIRPQDVVVVWKSDPIVGNPIVIRSDINPAFADKVRKAFMDMSVDDPKDLKAFISMYSPAQADSLNWITIKDADFDGLRKIVSGTSDFK